MPSINSKSFKVIVLIWLAVSFADLYPGSAGRAQDIPLAENQQKKSSYAELSQYVQNALAAETVTIEQLKEELRWLEDLGRSIKTEKPK